MARQHDSYAGARKDRHKLHLRKVREREQRDEERRFKTTLTAVNRHAPEAVRIIDYPPAKDTIPARGDWDLRYRALLITIGIVAAVALFLWQLWTD